MKKGARRVATHPGLTPEKKRELQVAYEQEEKGSNDPATQAEHNAAFERIEARKIIEGLTRQLLLAQQRQNLSYSDLATRTGIHRSNINRLLHGEQNNMTLVTILKIASALNLEVEIRLKSSAQTHDAGLTTPE